MAGRIEVEAGGEPGAGADEEPERRERAPLPQRLPARRVIVGADGVPLPGGVEEDPEDAGVHVGRDTAGGPVEGPVGGVGVGLEREDVVDGGVAELLGGGVEGAEERGRREERAGGEGGNGERLRLVLGELGDGEGRVRAVGEAVAEGRPVGLRDDLPAGHERREVPSCGAGGDAEAAGQLVLGQPGSYGEEVEETVAGGRHAGKVAYGSVLPDNGVRSLRTAADLSPTAMASASGGHRARQYTRLCRYEAT